ncbi:amino acid ABC transporter ATP-binding protein [Anopheles sinensis]|uniref:Amino acid ABC transporter ATP-binding protein n=1 Tax=Anopheles sinensis TaxID=74873 RepID=A0A084WSR7_ANOSI|nr:amino acid ABC transporter ATP-binding protein [Anopheles sinensis]
MWSLLNLHQAQAIDNEPFSSLSTDLPKRAKDLGKLKQELLELDRTLDRGTVLRQRLQLGQCQVSIFP